MRELVTNLDWLAHFSPDGRHLVAATAFGLLYFAWDFARVENGMMFSDITEHLFLEEPIRDVSWDSHVRRLAVRTVSASCSLTHPLWFT